MTNSRTKIGIPQPLSIFIDPLLSSVDLVLIQWSEIATVFTTRARTATALRVGQIIALHDVADTAPKAGNAIEVGTEV